MKYYLYNAKANSGIEPDFPAGVEPIDAIGLDYKKFFAELAPEDEVVLVGGDGTVNYFINEVDTDNLKNKVYWQSAGTGNDLLRDLEEDGKSEILLNDLVKNLPHVLVNGMDRKFINGIGYGIDGYCCEVADRRRANNMTVNYSTISVNGILFFFKARHAFVKVDGVETEHDKVWIAATMKGRYYGGGLKIAPAQDRKKDTVSVVVYKTGSRLKALMNFTSVFKGEHVKKTDMVKVYEGKEIEVGFTTPCALQIDGETVLNVSSYKVIA